MARQPSAVLHDPCRSPHMDGQVVPGRNNPAGFCLGWIPRRRYVGIRPLKHRQHPRSALHPAPGRVGTGQMTLQVSNSVFAATDQMKGNMIDLDSRFVSHYQHTEAVVIYVLQEPVLVFLAEVFGDVHSIVLLVRLYGWEMVRQSKQ